MPLATCHLRFPPILELNVRLSIGDFWRLTFQKYAILLVEGLRLMSGGRNEENSLFTLDNSRRVPGCMY
jgi:hypothetical protein